MTRAQMIRALEDLDACDEAGRWVQKTKGTPAQLWTKCKRSDWMIWLLAEIGLDARTLRHLACDFAETVLKHVEAESLLATMWAIECGRQLAEGKADQEEVDAARSAAESAAWSAAWSAAESVAWSAARYAAGSAQTNLIRARVPWSTVESLLKKKETAR